MADFLAGFHFQGKSQLNRFLSQGIWEHDGDALFLDRVKEIQPGDRIALKASYVRKRGLPFENRGVGVSVMSIKAAGIVTQNPGDGLRVQVDWKSLDREWYFYTGRGTLWRLKEDDWAANALRDFIFNGAEQNVSQFLAKPHWNARYLIDNQTDEQFSWIPFYQEFATRLLGYKERRKELLKGIKVQARKYPQLRHLEQDRLQDGSMGFVRDICPFTVMGCFNRGIRNDSRHEVAQALGKLIGVKSEAPNVWFGIPILNNLMSKFFPWESERGGSHMKVLWELMEAALSYEQERDESARNTFLHAFDAAMILPNVGWTVTFALYWMRPHFFPPLDANSRTLMKEALQLAVGTHGPQRRCSGQDYLDLMDELDLRLQQEDCPFHSIPEISMAAWNRANNESETPRQPSGIRPALLDNPPLELSYSYDQLIEDGSFLRPQQVEQMVADLREKKNLILQGAPGTGKTWIARRLGWLLTGARDTERVRAVQFHPNLSYEDFVRGYRPQSNGSLCSQDGVFLEMVKKAQMDPAHAHVLVIEEINRGNPAQLFGELLTLLEADKRRPEDALRLCYPDADGLPTFLHLPDNLHIIGTMNIADRSLALVDFALRRRFAFINLEPVLDSTWRKWVVKHRGLDAELALEIGRRLQRLNQEIANDSRLGPAYRLGHSFVVPRQTLAPGTTLAWFQQLVRTQIQPQLDEYWFDAPDQSRKAVETLLADLA